MIILIVIHLSSGQLVTPKHFCKLICSARHETDFLALPSLTAQSGELALYISLLKSLCDINGWIFDDFRFNVYISLQQFKA